jgi:hypothetical protein
VFAGGEGRMTQPGNASKHAVDPILGAKDHWKVVPAMIQEPEDEVEVEVDIGCHKSWFVDQR